MAVAKGRSNQRTKDEEVAIRRAIDAYDEAIRVRVPESGDLGLEMDAQGSPAALRARRYTSDIVRILELAAQLVEEGESPFVLLRDAVGNARAVRLTREARGEATFKALVEGLPRYFHPLRRKTGKNATRPLGDPLREWETLPGSALAIEAPVVRRALLVLSAAASGGSRRAQEILAGVTSGLAWTDENAAKVRRYFGRVADERRDDKVTQIAERLRALDDLLPSRLSEPTKILAAAVDAGRDLFRKRWALAAEQGRKRWAQEADDRGRESLEPTADDGLFELNWLEGMELVLAHARRARKSGPLPYAVMAAALLDPNLAEDVSSAFARAEEVRGRQRERQKKRQRRTKGKTV